MAKVSKTFQRYKYESLAKLVDAPDRTKSCIGLNTLTAIKSDLKSGALVGILVQVQDGSPRPKVIVVVELAATAYK